MKAQGSILSIKDMFWGRIKDIFGGRCVDETAKLVLKVERLGESESARERERVCVREREREKES